MTRRGTGSLDTIAVAATASGGETIAPSATATAQGISGKHLSRDDRDHRRRHDHESDGESADLVDVSLELAHRREHRGRPQDRRQEHEEHEVRIELRNRDARHERDGEAGDHLENRRRHGQSPRERGERDHEHRDYYGEDDRFEMHCG